VRGESRGLRVMEWFISVMGESGAMGCSDSSVGWVNQELGVEWFISVRGESRAHSGVVHHWEG